MNTSNHSVYRIISLLERSKNFIDQLFSSLPGVMISVDPSLRILRINDAGAEMLGGTADSVLGRPIKDLFDDAAFNVVKPLIENLFKNQGESVELEVQARDSQLGPISFHWQFSRFGSKVDQSGALVNLVGHDITELRGVLKTKLSLERDLDLAAAAQNLLLPSENLISTKNWSLAAHYETASQAGGDWWNLEMLSNGRTIFMLGDVTGHGAGSAMVTALMTGAYKAFISQKGPDIPGLLNELDQQLKKLIMAKYWMTFVVLDLDSQSGKLEWYCASAPDTFVVSRDGSVLELGGPGRPLGSGDLKFQHGHVQLKKGDRIFCATDGVYEVHPKVSTTGVRRAISKVLAEKNDSPEQIREKIKAFLSKWRQGDPPQDDTAFFILDYLGN